MSVTSKAIVQDIVGEIPEGDIDGINKNFELDFIPTEDSIEVILNGIDQSKGALLDYTIIGKIISFIKAPNVGSKILVNYRI